MTVSNYSTCREAFNINYPESRLYYFEIAEPYQDFILFAASASLRECLKKSIPVLKIVKTKLGSSGNVQSCIDTT